jgi:hypothetical protein
MLPIKSKTHVFSNVFDQTKPPLVSHSLRQIFPCLLNRSGAEVYLFNYEIPF